LISGNKQLIPRFMLSEPTKLLVVVVEEDSILNGVLSNVLAEMDAFARIVSRYTK